MVKLFSGFPYLLTLFIFVSPQNELLVLDNYPLARMHIFRAFKLGIFLIASSKCVSALNCVACSHDPSSSSSSDLTCVGNLDGHPDVVVIECNPEYGDQVCYTMVNCEGNCYHNPDHAPEDMKWYRGCCNPGSNSWVCPTDQPDHVDSGWYETWHTRCDTDSCNNKEPWTNREDTFFSQP